MKRHYFNSIASFAITLPIIVSFIAITVINKVKTSSLTQFEGEKALFTNDITTQRALESLRKKNAQKKEISRHWSKLISGDNYSKFNTSLHAAKEANNKTKTLQIVEQGRSTRPELGVDSNLSACKLTMQGTFSELQRTLTQLECSTPQLMVNQFDLKPQTSGELLTINLTYTLWEK